MPASRAARIGDGFRWLRASWRRMTVAAAAVALLAAGGAWGILRDQPGLDVENQRVTVLSGPNNDEPITLDTTLYVPDDAGAANPAPAVLLAHGFGGTKHSVRADAKRLAREGYIVLAWTARGFGDSDGEVNLNNPDYEVNDAKRLIDLLAKRPDVTRDGDGDPRVAVVGASYGGALALLLAGHDQRVDAIVPQITWNDLSRSLFPESTGQDATHGVFKRAWAGVFFGSNELRNSRSPVTDTSRRADPTCGRLAADICQLYLTAASSGRADAATMTRLRRSSPANVLGNIKAPTLLMQGTRDTLFDTAEADANARGIAATGTDVQVAWFAGGHDAVPSAADNNRLRDLTKGWLRHYLGGHGKAPKPEFSYSRAAGFVSRGTGIATTSYTVAKYPGLASPPRNVPVSGPAQRVANPPDGTPSAISSIPGLAALSELSGLITGLSQDIDGQHATFESTDLRAAVTVVGEPTVRVRVASATGEATLFVKLYDVDPKRRAGIGGTEGTLIGGVAPIRLSGLASDITRAEAVTVRLPGVAHKVVRGHRLRLVVATSDQAYAGPREPAVYQIGLDTPTTPEAARSILTLPTVEVTGTENPGGAWAWALLSAGVLVAIGVAGTVVVTKRRHRRQEHTVVTEFADSPLVVRGLSKTYAGGFTAVHHTDFTVERDQVVGLLGPNGAGKTTTMRMLLGLIRPSGGDALIFGHRVGPGAPALSQVGALVEGPGFLPHLSGRQNLRLFWEATGRPVEDARFDEVLDIADLGEAIERKVRTYSHGMKQRLAIAQAMLGMPSLLLLDEPTDGLDPPQIAAMRQVLSRYATQGRAVLVSSHLLGEVEQTCTHVVVMHRGRSVATGPVGDVIGQNQHLEDAFLELVNKPETDSSTSREG